MYNNADCSNNISKKNNIDFTKYSTKSIWKVGEYLKVGDIKESPNGKVKIYASFNDNVLLLNIKNLNGLDKDINNNIIYDKNIFNEGSEDISKYKNNLCFKLTDNKYVIGHLNNNVFNDKIYEDHIISDSFLSYKFLDDKIGKLVPAQIIINNNNIEYYLYDDNGNIINKTEENNFLKYPVYNISYILLRDDGAFIFDKNNILQGIL